MVFYRKYRPQTIAELDLTTVREKLTSILSSDNIPHAFLFAGPKGLGKTSSARILAKAINCEQKLTTNNQQLTSNRKKAEKLAVSSQKSEVESIEPCNKCSACISITNGSAVDVIEIDAASNRGIDEIRDLKERIKFAASALKKKVYIIDEVHMLTTEAFNALLKTLEEPPEHVMFILATTELGKLPGTITSRTFYVEFKKPTSEELERSLERVVNGEKLELEDGVLQKVASLSDGAFRDGAKILEDLSLHSGSKQITLALIEELYKTGTTQKSASEIVELTLKNNTKDALAVVQELVSVQADYKLVIQEVAEILHDMLLTAVSKKDTATISNLQKFLLLIDDAYKNMKGAVIPQLPLELAIIGYSIKEEDSQVVIRALEKQETKGEGSQVAHHDSKIQKEPVLDARPATNEARQASSDQDTFKKLLDAVNSENKILAGLLRGSHLEISNDTAKLKPQSNFHRDKLSENQNRSVIEAKLKEISGNTIQLEFV